MKNVFWRGKESEINEQSSKKFKKKFKNKISFIIKIHWLQTAS